ncbi:MAG TPA: ATP-binding protein [Acetobacteraceae bacterium]|nr:ATP-binding protein [Acetobacteraceae bacterium]
MAALAGFLSVLLVLTSVGLARQTWRGRVLTARLRAVEATGKDAVRLARMAASDLRGPALGLLGSAEQAPAELKPTLIGTCRFLLDLAEALLDQTEQPGTSRKLKEEEVALGPLLDFVVAQVAGQLAPGRRSWRIAEQVRHVKLTGDRRALHQVLLRVVTGAALSTRDGDWIEISAATRDAWWELAVQDEGAGLLATRAAGGGPDTRGLGVGLSLARQLMQAHGGELAMESMARVGTRALLRLPVERVVTERHNVEG